MPLPLGEVAERSEGGEGLPLPLGEVAERSEDGEGLPLPLGEVAERSEGGEGRDANVTCVRVSQAKLYFSTYFGNILRLLFNLMKDYHIGNCVYRCGEHPRNRIGIVKAFKRIHCLEHGHDPKDSESARTE